MVAVLIIYLILAAIVVGFSLLQWKKQEYYNFILNQQDKILPPKTQELTPVRQKHKKTEMSLD